MKNAFPTAPAPLDSHPTTNRRRVRNGTLASFLAFGLVLGSGSYGAAGAQEYAPALAPEHGEPDVLRFAADTPAVEGSFAALGSFPELETPLGFRAETRHIPWLALGLAVLILIQWLLLRLRNRVRDRIHRAPGTSDPTLPELSSPTMKQSLTKETIRRETIRKETVDPSDGPDDSKPDLETVIGEELVHVFDEAALRFDESTNDAKLRELLIALATSVAARAEARVELTDVDQGALRTALVDAVLEAFDLAPHATA